MSVQGATRSWFRVDYEKREKRCARCLRTKPFDEFYLFQSAGKERVSSYCKPCFIRYQRQRTEKDRKGPPRRMPKRNGNGDAWCPNCQKYLSPTRFRPHPSRPGLLWAYCNPCTQELDRLRYRYMDPETKQAQIKRRGTRKKQHARGRRESRENFVQDAISLLRKRGFSSADICAMGRFQHGNLLEWERGVRKERGIQPAVERTFGQMLLITQHYATGAVEKRGGRPHPDRSRLVAEMDEIWPGLGRRKRKGAA